MTNTLARCGLITLAGYLAVALGGGALAMPSCEGTYAAESLRQLPPGMVVGLDIRDPSPEHLGLAQRFLAGMRTAGVTVGAQPSVLLSISSTRLDTSDQQPGGAAQVNPDHSNLEGGFQFGLPAMPTTNLTAPATPPAPPLLIFRVEAKEPQEARISWVANVQCQMIGIDDGARAEDLGRVIGAALGQRIDRRPY